MCLMDRFVLITPGFQRVCVVFLGLGSQYQFAAQRKLFFLETGFSIATEEAERIGECLCVMEMITGASVKEMKVSWQERRSYFFFSIFKKSVLQV